MSVAPKKGKKKQPSLIKGFPVFRSNAKPVEASGGGKNDRLGSAQENPKAFPFDWRVKAADGGDAALNKLLHQIMSL